jgi:hypothetical protein
LLHEWRSARTGPIPVEAREAGEPGGRRMNTTARVLDGNAIPGEEAKSRRSARLFSLAVLAIVMALLGRGVFAAYHALTDGFVSPIIFSPDSDTVIQNKLSMSRLVSDRDGVNARIEESRLSIAAADSAIRVLRGLKGTSSSRVQWATEVAGGEAARSVADLDALRSEKEVLLAVLERQEGYVKVLERGLAAGLVRKDEVDRARNGLDHARVELLKNEREQHSAARELRVASLARAALASQDGRGLSTPEMVALREEVARTSVELLKAESERRARAAQLRADEEALSHLDELMAQMKKRPVYRAIENSQTVAFVTYEELSRVKAGATVLRCAMWGFFGCRPVGIVAEVLPGEVAMQDSFGALGRGQYAVLDLADPTAAQARSLRVRGTGATPSAGGAVAALR